MRIYPKKLRSVEDLEREKKLLLKESERMDEEGFLSLDGILGKKKGGKGEDEGGSLLDYLPVSNPVVNLVVKFIQKKLSQKGSKQKDTYSASYEEPKKGRSPLKAFAFEFIGGYLKWKAIELSYKGLRHLIKKNKKKRAAEK